MQRKLNDEFIREYSEEFSEKITSSFFENTDKISGKDILTATPSKQVNFFVLKILFRKWQEEMKQLESPFFNYKAPEVRKAMVQFMNTLSQHIEVGPDHYKLMLEEAVANSLLLATDPASYLMLEFDELDVPQVNEKITKPILKYLRLHKDTISAFFERNNRLNIDDFLDAIPEYFEDVQVQDAVDEELQRLSEIVPISEEDIFITENFVNPLDEDDDEEFPGFAEDLIEEEETVAPIAPEPETEEPEAFEDEEEAHAEQQDTEDTYEEESYEPPKSSRATKGLAIARTVEPDPEPDEEAAEAANHEEEELQEHEETEFQPTSEPVEEEIPQEEDTYEQEETDEPESDEDSQEENIQEEETVAQQEPTSEEADDASVNENYEAPQATINDRFSEENNTLADKMEKRKVNSIMEAISVNHRYMFTKELFDGDRDAFTNTVDELEACDSFDDAVEMLVQNYAKPRDWDMNSDEVKELLKVVFRKFR
ncbi:hypothetical protein [Marinoscillum furvescens]|uniref:Uncharacterized protein n=1 Tax=Marinoscillum furvescens DSM 4134 TaxID=1122208 RepID=A0A3D9L857_MARFU|nr:hypothetical protein [Marinoscillum furvescens]REE01693.1 hypothetical protein C7460_103210 [Marinoscillum furvescens DSM 4134]